MRGNGMFRMDKETV
jgi:hypothetical protein